VFWAFLLDIRLRSAGRSDQAARQTALAGDIVLLNATTVTDAGLMRGN